MKPIASLLVVTAALATGGAADVSREQLVDDWGSVLYCQRLYREPDVRGMIYAGDHRACDSAQELIEAAVRRDFPPGQAQEIAREAAHRAQAIRRNTRSAQDAITACRQHCRELSSNLAGKP